MRREVLLALSLGLASVVMVNVLVDLKPVQIDLTADARHTLSPITIKLLRSAQSPIEAHFYRPSDLGAGHAVIAKAITDTLDALRDASGGRFRYRIIDPIDPALSPEARQQRVDAAAAVGIEPVEVQRRQTDRARARRVPFGVALLSLDRQATAPVVTSSQHVELALATALRRVVLNLPVPTIGIATGHGEPDLINSPLASRLASSGQLKAVTLDGSRISRELDALLILAPTRHFDAAAIEAIDAYQGRGGGLILWADYLEQSKVVPDVLVPVQTGLEPLFAHHGLTIQAGLTVVDTEHNAPAPIGRDASGRVVSAHHPLYALSAPINGDHAITRNLRTLVLPAATPITVSGDAVSLVESRPEARLRSAVRSLAPEKLGKPVPDRVGPFTAAACVESHQGPLAGDGQRLPISRRLAVVTSARRLLAADPNALILLQNILEWTVTSADLSAVRAKGQSDPDLRPLTTKDRALIRYGTLFGTPLAFLLLTLAASRRRRRGQSQ